MRASHFYVIDEVMTLLETVLEKEPAKNHEALKGFAAGWDACIDQYGGFLLAHGFSDFCTGFEKRWGTYRDDKFYAGEEEQ